MRTVQVCKGYMLEGLPSTTIPTIPTIAITADELDAYSTSAFVLRHLVKPAGESTLPFTTVLGRRRSCGGLLLLPASPIASRSGRRTRSRRGAAGRNVVDCVLVALSTQLHAPLLLVVMR